jgi:hypothetical protein
VAHDVPAGSGPEKERVSQPDVCSSAMGLREFFRRHRNVFSASTEWVDTGSGAVDMIEEEYGDQATETVNGSKPMLIGSAFAPFAQARRVSARTSVDGILEIGEDDADAEKPRS